MKRLIRTLVLTAVAIALLWQYLPSALVPQPITVEAISPKQMTVYESIACDGTLRSAETFRLSIGVPAEILEVYVQPGDLVSAGQPLISYRCLSTEEITAGLYSTELSNRLQSTAERLDDAKILAAAEYYAVSGELPSYFKDFYLPPDTIVETAANSSGVLVAPKDGTVTSVFCSGGDLVSGLFTAAVVENTVRIVAQLRAPEATLPKLVVGLPVNISGAAFGDRIFPARVSAIGTQAIATGGLLGKSETYIEVTAEINTSDMLMSGLTVRGTIFFIAYDNAVVVPHEAITVDEKGKEFVYRYVDGVLHKTPITVLYENDDGVVCGGEIALTDQLVRSPSADLRHGSVVVCTNVESEASE
ncbi:MAG: hypothetical protein E7452_00685 [Ruminococcaceae bacterium]|nr:hypothetical protein [Oscillospiraceae bacterium]